MKFLLILLSCTTFITIFSACDAIEDLADPDAKTHCEAICEWAVACQTTQQPELDTAQATTDCVAALESADPTCKDSVEAKKSAACTSEVDGRTDMCDIFTGDAQTRTAATADLPGECAPNVELFSEAAAVTGESGDALCTRLNNSICARMVECLGEYGVPNEALEEIDLLGLCMDSISSIEDSCQSSDLYEASADPTTPNPTRDFAMQCADSFSTRSCGDFFTSAPDTSCAGAFTSPDQAAELLGGVQSFACGQSFAMSIPGCQ